MVSTIHGLCSYLMENGHRNDALFCRQDSSHNVCYRRYYAPGFFRFWFRFARVDYSQRSDFDDRSICLSLYKAHIFVVENLDQPYRELLVWAVLYNRKSLAMIFWKECSDPLGSAVVASVMFKTLARKATLAKDTQLADELVANAGFVIIFSVLTDNVIPLVQLVSAKLCFVVYVK